MSRLLPVAWAVWVAWAAWTSESAAASLLLALHGDPAARRGFCFPVIMLVRVDQRGRCWRSHCTMAAAGMAPDWRARSWPPCSSTIVGMLRMPKRVANAGSASVSSLPKRTCGSNCAAAWANSGAICRHGPHHDAQKSISNGNCERCAWAWNAVASSVTGAPTNKGWWQRPQAGNWPNRVAGTRLMALQCGQAICSRSRVSAFTSASRGWGSRGAMRASIARGW